MLFPPLTGLCYSLPNGALLFSCFFIISPVFLQTVSLCRIPRRCYAMSIGYLAFYCHAREVHFRLLTCSITSVTFVFELNLMSFCPDVLRVTCFFPYLFVRLLVYSLSGWWVPMFPRRMSLLEVRMTCRLWRGWHFGDGYDYRCFPEGRNHTCNKDWNAGPNSTAHSLNKPAGMPSGPGDLLALDYFNWFVTSKFQYHMVGLKGQQLGATHIQQKNLGCQICYKTNVCLKQISMDH